MRHTLSPPARSRQKEELNEMTLTLRRLALLCFSRTLLKINRSIPHPRKKTTATLKCDIDGERERKYQNETARGGTSVVVCSLVGVSDIGVGDQKQFEDQIIRYYPTVQWA